MPKSLYEQIEEEEKVLETESEGEEVADDKPDDVEDDTEVAGEEEETEEVKEETKEELKEEAKAEVKEEDKTAKDYYWERKNKDLQKKIDELSVQKKEAPIEQKQVIQEELDEIEVMKQALSEIKTQQYKQNLLQQAVAEFQDYEAGFAKEATDYDQVTDFYRQKMTDSFKTLHPNMNEKQVEQAVSMKILEEAGNIVKYGLNPAEELYNRAKKMGFTPKIENPTVEVKPKIDLKTIDKNRKKSASALSGRGNSQTTSYTLDEVADMTPAQLLKLDPKILRELEGM